MNSIQNFLIWIVALAVLAVVAVFIIIANVPLNPRESTLVGIILTMISVGATWIAAHWYSKGSQERRLEEIKSENTENIRLFALKAAEKVLNSSNELGRLSTYLENASDRSSDENNEISLRILDERIEGAIHLVQTIKSLNDTSLSDWEGVIGEELERKREEDEERVDEIREIIDKLESIDRESQEFLFTDFERTKNFETELESIRAEIRNLVSQSSKYPQLATQSGKKRSERLAAPCPSCGANVRIRKTKRGTPRYGGAECKVCETMLVVTVNDDGQPELAVRKNVVESISCPNCINAFEIEFDNVIGSHIDVNCENCDAEIRVSRTAKGMAVRIPDRVSSSSGATRVDEKFMKKVEALLPEQPWPQGIHREIALKLGTSRRKVSIATKQLIEMGKFKQQINGILYDVIEKDEKSDT